MRRLMMGMTALLLAGFALAQDKAKDERAEKLAALAKDSKAAADDFLKQYRETKDKEAKAKAIEGYRAAPKKFAPQVLDLAKAKPDDETGLDAAIWIVQFARDGKESTEAVEIIRKHHLASPKMANAVGSVSAALGKDAPKFLEEVFEKNPDRKVKAFTLRTMASNALDKVQDYLTPEQEIPAKVAEAGKLWERLAKEFGDVEWGRTKMEEMAKDNVAMLKSFSPGCKAAEIVGEDTEGKPIKLSDFAGKVVMLDFWGTWCGPCMQMVPHNIETAKKFEGKPFVLVGVNSDQDKEQIAERLKAAKLDIQYRSFWNGKEGPSGAISKEWKVQGWPTVVLIDHKGIIRHRFLGSPDTAEEFKGLDKALEKLVKEAEVR